MSGMYEQWGIKVSDVAYKLNRDYTCEPREIIRAAEDCGYVNINYTDELIQGEDEDGYRCIIAELE